MFLECRHLTSDFVGLKTMEEIWQKMRSEVIICIVKEKMAVWKCDTKQDDVKTDKYLFMICIVLENFLWIQAL
jgi:hypothetical protein